MLNYAVTLTTGATSYVIPLRIENTRILWFGGAIMRTFDYSSLKYRTWDNDILNYLSQIHEYKGKQELYLSKSPEKLEKLVEIAKIQSTESSNAIEGIRTTNARLMKLCSDKTTPKNRSEQEILGYRNVLNIVHESFEYIPIRPSYILQLHRELYALSALSIGGKYKNGQNYISGVDPEGNQYTIFTPLSPFETPEAIQQICDEYNKAIDQSVVDPLLLIPVFIHDFLCIHPFNDGNGRMSRLITTLLLYRAGYVVGRYVSLEKIVSENKELYYDTLQSSQDGWHEGCDDPSPFIKYLLGTILAAYREFERRMDIITENLPAIEKVRKATSFKIGKFNKTDIMELCPALSNTTVQKALSALVNDGYLERHGNGKATFYTVK